MTEEFLEEISAMTHQGYFRVHLPVQLDACKETRMNVRMCPELQFLLVRQSCDHALMYC